MQGKLDDKIISLLPNQFWITDKTTRSQSRRIRKISLTACCLLVDIVQEGPDKGQLADG